MARISFIIPCFQNEGNIPALGRALIANEKRFPRRTRCDYIFVDDGSTDNTFRALRAFQRKYSKKVTIVKLSRNFGANNASLAGLSVAHGNCIVILAADLQDPPELVPSMFAYWAKGTKLVLATRKNPTGLLPGIFHTLMRRFIFPSAPRSGFDLCLFDRALQKDMLAMKEKNVFIPYLLLWLGYPYVTIPYERRKRTIGQSQWSFGKRIKTCIDAFVSFTYLPVRAITVCGLFLSLAAFGYAIAVIHARLTSTIPVEGWTSLVIILLFVSSFQMIALGVIGEYLWRTLDATRARPPYIIEKIS